MQPLIAMPVKGILVSHEPWEKAHAKWFLEAARRLRDPTLESWIDREDYFEGVDKVMRLEYPQLTDEQRTIKAREIYFQYVHTFIEGKPTVINTEMVTLLNELKDKIRIGIITTNPVEWTKRLLRRTGLHDATVVIEGSAMTEKDDKAMVLNRFITKNGAPLLYLSSTPKGIRICKELNIPALLVDFAGQQLDAVHDISTLHKKILEAINK